MVEWLLSLPEYRDNPQLINAGGQVIHATSWLTVLTDPLSQSGKSPLLVSVEQKKSSVVAAFVRRAIGAVGEVGMRPGDPENCMFF